MTLEEIKEQIAVEKGYSCWVNLFNNSEYTYFEIHMEEVARRYAKAKLEEAAEKAKVQTEKFDGSLGQSMKSFKLPMFRQKVIVDKESITNINLD